MKLSPLSLSHNLNRYDGVLSLYHNFVCSIEMTRFIRSVKICCRKEYPMILLRWKTHECLEV
jgi:hypothetical protein